MKRVQFHFLLTAFGKDQAVSKTLMISGFDYTVIGVYELKNDFEEEVLYLPSESALEEQGYTLAGAARIYLKSDQDIDRTVKQFFRAYKGEEKEWVCVDQRNGTKPFQEHKKTICIIAIHLI